MRTPIRRASRKTAVVLLAAMMAWMPAAFAQAQATGAAQGDIVRSAIEKQGIGKRIAIRLASGETLHGTITRVGSQSFDLRPDHSRSAREIPYSQVEQIKSASRTLLWAVLGISAVAIVVIIVALARTPSTHTA